MELPCVTLVFSLGMRSRLKSVESLEKITDETYIARDCQLPEKGLTSATNCTIVNSTDRTHGTINSCVSMEEEMTEILPGERRRAAC